MSVKKNIGNLVEVRENISFKWKVKDFFSQKLEVNEYWDSPTFYLSGAQSYLRLYPNGKEHVSSGYVTIYLEKEKTSNKANGVAFTIGLIGNNDSVYISSENAFSFEDNGLGCIQLVERSQLLKDKEKIAFEGVLTFFFKAQVLREEDAQLVVQNNPLQREEMSQPLSLRKAKEDILQQAVACLLEIENSAASAISRLEIATSAAPALEEEKVSVFTQMSHEETHLNALTQTFLDFFLNGKNCDVTIRIGDYEIQAHRLVLVIRSSVFASEIGNDFHQRKRNSVIDLEDFKPEIVKDFLLYLYTSQMKQVSTKHAIDLYVIAQKYNVLQLSQKCIWYILKNFTVESFCDIVCLAMKFKETELLKSAEIFFIQYVQDILITASWLSFMREHSFVANKFLMKLADKVSTQCNCNDV